MTPQRSMTPQRGEHHWPLWASANLHARCDKYPVPIQQTLLLTLSFNLRCKIDEKRVWFLKMLINLKDAVYAVPIVVGGLLLLLCLRAVFNASFSSLRSIPGPFWARLTRFWYLKKVWRGDFEKTNIQLHAKYGKWFK